MCIFLPFPLLSPPLPPPPPFPLLLSLPPSIINTFFFFFLHDPNPCPLTYPLFFTHILLLIPFFHKSVRGGIDYKLTGEVRRIEVENLKKRLEAGDVVLLTSLGYSPSGEVFNVPSESLAAECAAKMQAAKLIYLTEGEALVDTRSGKLLQSLRLAQVTYCLFPLPYQCNLSTPYQPTLSPPTLSTHPTITNIQSIRPYLSWINVE